MEELNKERKIKQFDINRVFFFFKLQVCGKGVVDANYKLKQGTVL